jgi:cobalt-zinc-cadmium efflux system outer membrane protein
MRFRWIYVAVVLVVIFMYRPLRAAEGESLTMEVAVALALEKNRDVIAARLDIRSAELDEVAASVYPNPLFSYSVDNLPLGQGNPNNAEAGAPASPSFFSQTVQTFGISEVIDVWSKRGARIRAAERGTEQKRWQVADALREIVHAVRSAFADVVREQGERQLSHDMRDRYAETIRLSRSRFGAGEISEADFRKIELEGLKYEQDVVDADSEYDIARQKLAALIGYGSEAELPASLAEDRAEQADVPVDALVERALRDRPDVRAAERARAFAEASIGAARREALPDISLGVSYTHSDFLASGDNPNTLGLSLSLPIPIFDRNQANIGRAELDLRRAVNDAARLEIVVRREVKEAARRVARGKSLIGLFRSGGMLERAEKALKVAETSYRAGAISLLEFLEAERTFLDTRAQYLRAEYDYRQSRIDLNHAIGSLTP